MAQLSVITSFRDRDIRRVERFLHSLAGQTDKDFELIFLDYGSQDPTATAVRAECDKYAFCRYHYNDTRGMLWNRAHAMNSAVRLARSDWVLFTDVDLIFSDGCIARLKQGIEPGIQFFCRAYFLPHEFDDYASLASRPTGFRLTSMKTRGLFHCVERQAFAAVGGFDEYYCIWGLEDTQLAASLRQSGVESRWLDSAAAPMYHQWHPSSAKLSGAFPPKWWENMVTHAALNNQEAMSFSKRGRMLREQDRPSLMRQASTTIRVPCELDPHGRGRVIQDIIFFLKHYPGEVLEVRVKPPAREAIDWTRQSRNAALSRVINGANRLLAGLKLPVALIHRRPLRIMQDYTFNPEQSKATPESLYYVIHRLIWTERLVQDYHISRDTEGTVYRLVG